MFPGSRPPFQQAARPPAPATGAYTDGNPSWAKKWQALSDAHAKPKHVPGWRAGDTGSVIRAPEDHVLAGPWVNGKDPAAG